MTDADIIAEMCGFTRTVQAVAESLHAEHPTVARSAIVDRIHAMIDDGRIDGHACSTKAGNAMLVRRAV